MSKYRTTLEVLRSGQPRPYADTEYVARVSFERTDIFRPKDLEFHPAYMSMEIALSKLKGVEGYTERKRSGGNDWHMTYLDYVKMIDVKTADMVLKGGDPHQLVAYIFEFRTVTPYTD